MKQAVYSLGGSLDILRNRLLEYSRGFRHAAILDSFSDKGAVVPVTGIRYDLIAGFGAGAIYYFEDGGFQGLDDFIARHRGDWILGHIAYDLKNDIEKLKSRHHDNLGFGKLCFFVPESTLIIQGDKVIVYGDRPESVWDTIHGLGITDTSSLPTVTLFQNTAKEAYLASVEKALNHINAGNIYEMNFCHEFYAGKVTCDAVTLAKGLFGHAPGPFSCFYKMRDSFLICASPERFLLKSGTKLLSQPIKGTAARHPDPALDKMHLLQLSSDPKERSENVMIVDLVRNDLSRVAMKGSVQVDELFGVYTFPGAHQMISSISCNVKEGTSFSQILTALFPMGSMTGAPKIRAMEIIDELEDSRRGLFSGSVGYISPDGDFDFNVVIRNIQYNAHTGYLSLMAGGAITAASVPDKEYLETLVKLRPQFNILGFQHQHADA